MTDVASTSFVAPVFNDPASFAEAVASGAFNATQLAWAESVFESRGLGDLANLLRRVREGRVQAADVVKVRRAIEKLASQRETKVRMALASAPWQAYPPRSRFAPFDPAMVAAALIPRVAEPAAFVTAGGATGNVTPHKPIQHASSPTSTPPAVGMLDIYTTTFLREVVAALYSAQLITAARPGLIQDESIREVRVDHFFPSEVTDRLDRIFYELDGLSWDTLQTGPDVEQALNEVGIEGLVWKHTPTMGSFVILHRTPIVPGASKPGLLVLAVLPKGHQAPSHVHRSGTTNLPGEITLGVEGTLRYRDYNKPDDPNAEIQTAPLGQVRFSPAGSKDVYLRQEDLWVGIYWQPEPSQNVGETRTTRELLLRCKAQLDELGLLLEAETVEDSSAAEIRQRLQERETRELIGIVDSDFTFVKNARATLDQWRTEPERAIAQQRITVHLARLRVIVNILRARRVLWLLE